MTIPEFSNEFDILYNNIMSNQAPGLDEYEKSVFLTKAQGEIIKKYFSMKENKSLEGFDDSQKRQYDFSSLIRTKTLFNVNSVKERITQYEKTDKRSQVFIFPEDYFLSVNEIIFDSKQMYSVIPLTYEEYQRVMLKPYALPVKRGAWRLFTDKKNCNFVREYIAGTQCDYNLLTTWADQKRNLKLTIKYNDTAIDVVGMTHESIVVTSDSFTYYSEECESFISVTADCGWSNDKLTYEVVLTVKANQIDEDADIITALREGFNLYQKKGYLTSSGDFAKAATHLDNLMQAEAPSKFKNFSVAGGKTLVTSHISLPIAEIIGSFTGDITYQLRYVRTPKPIILVDLASAGVSINGITEVTPCELSSELHSEILQRAVELAKAAYTGDLQSQLLLGQSSETNIGTVAQQR